MSKNKERFDKDLDVDGEDLSNEVDESDEVDEVEPPDLDELGNHLQDSLREHEASDDYSEEPKVDVEPPEEANL